MKKIYGFIRNNFLFILSLFLLAFIPLYPKIPIIDIRNTWVYVRLEDFVVLFVLLFWVALLFLKKVNLKTPLTMPILIFWAVGAIATLHGILLIFPLIANVFPNVAFMSFLRQIEYMSLFFIAYQGAKDKKIIGYATAVITITLLGVIAYGFGQKYLGFPAFLTMNEEFAKGVPLTLSALSRVPSTFAGHYDLAAYLVLIIPIVFSMIFGLKNIFAKLILLITSFFGLVLLFMTVSRVSFVVLFISLFIVLFFQKRKLILLVIPIILAFLILIFSFQTSLFNRFKSTIKEIDVLVDAKTGVAIGEVNFVNGTDFKDKVVLQKNVKNKEELDRSLTGDKNDPLASPTAILEYKYIPKIVPLVTATNVSTGETLPQGTGYINLALSPVVNRLDSFFYEFPPNVKATTGADDLVLHGDFLIKKAAAYDLSFTTRFQGEWPRALEAFQRNVLIGSGYGSVSLAVDNNYLRILAETGLLGFIAFLIILLTLGIYVKQIWPNIESKAAKSFVLGFSAGVIGLALNATLIDVFEASKIAFVLWILMGLVFATLSLYQTKAINLLHELKKLAVSTWAIAIYLFSLVIILFSSTLNNFFIGDDYTWLKWAANTPFGIMHYFTVSDGFFYRPGTKLYFYIMYHFFWLNQGIYHAVSVFLHFAIAVLFFILAKKIFKKTVLAFFAAVFFLISSGSMEMVLWIASTGHLFNIFFGLLGLLFFIYWDEKKKWFYYLLSFVFFALSLPFYELGVVLPFLIVAYKLKDEGLSGVKKLLGRKDFFALFIPVIIYLIIRFFAGSHWSGGDYNYNLIKLPFNFVGNLIGYVSLIVLGPAALPFYEKIRILARGNIIISFIVVLIVIAALYYLGKLLSKKFDSSEKSIMLFGFLFSVISLLPFIGLGNITSRYSYLASMGIIFILVVLVKKLYNFLLSNGKEIAVAVVVVIMTSYSLFHIIQLQQTSSDWAGAGEKSRMFFVSIDSLYTNNWAAKPVELHFVNVPIRYGQAWVFPVGLDDAVWFSFKNNNIKVYKHLDLNSALVSTSISPNNKILIFNDDGSLKEYQLIKKTTE
jgi:hypothetical protein